MNYFIVMQNASYEEELKGGYMWSPQKNKNGGSNHAYERMKEVKKGDIVFSCYKKAIRAVGKVLSDCYEDNQPKELQAFNQWDNKGFKVNVEYKMLKDPIFIAKYWDDMKNYRPSKYSAFQINGRGNQAYLFYAVAEWAELFKTLSGSLETEIETETEDIDVVESEITKEVLASSSIQKGLERVGAKINSKKFKKNNVSSQEQIQNDIRERKRIGDIAEEKVFDYVKKKVAEVFGSEYARKVEHVAKTKGDGLGYDISAFDYRQVTNPPRPIAIEVKGTTSLDKLSSYFISYPELEKFIKNKESLWLVRVFGVTKQRQLVMEIDDSFKEYESAADLLE